jgi:uncharacterized protein DUF5681
MPVNFQQKQDGGEGRAGRGARGRFAKGASGNPAGRPPGSRNAATELAQALLDGEAAALIRKCVEMALDGNIAAIKLCLERLVPRCGRSAAVNIPEIATVADILSAMRGVARAAAAGIITATDGADLSRILESYLRAMEAGEFERRLKELEDDRAARA